MSTKAEELTIVCADGHDRLVIDRLVRRDGDWESRRPMSRPSNQREMYEGDRTNPLVDWTQNEGVGDVPVRSRWEFRCGHPLSNGQSCSRTVPAVDAKLQLALSILFDTGVTMVPLSILQGAIERVDPVLPDRLARRFPPTRGGSS